MKRRSSKRPKGPTEYKLGFDQERAIGHLQQAMAHCKDPKQRTLLAREARKIRIGTRDWVTTPQFGIRMGDLKRLIPIGVH